MYSQLLPIILDMRQFSKVDCRCQRFSCRYLCFLCRIVTICALQVHYSAVEGKEYHDYVCTN